ncbi:MAG: hypothetical protein E7395_06545 [Ruminococcaceae bacterium]|nr:hypothetical protein [Oscillospiraceae bacterium]
MRKILIKLCIIALILFLIVWGLSILKCEILTSKYGSQFELIHQENTMIGNIEYLKVLNYTRDTAQVYYVSENRSAGNILMFYKDNDNWCCDSWNTVWSKTGSADGFVWPYIR